MKMKAVVVVALKFITKKDLVRQIMLTILKMKVCSGKSSVVLASRSHIDCIQRIVCLVSRDLFLN